jgi:putative oxidoreductase
MSKNRSLFAAAPADVGLLMLRLFFGLTLAAEHGWFKIRDLAKFTHGVAAAGFPVPWLLAPASAATEFLGGLLIAIGLFTRPAAAFVQKPLSVVIFREPGHSRDRVISQ